jgi:hypothetical protein
LLEGEKYYRFGVTLEESGQLYNSMEYQMIDCCVPRCISLGIRVVASKSSSDSDVREVAHEKRKVKDTDNFLVTVGDEPVKHPPS